MGSVRFCVSNDNTLAPIYQGAANTPVLINGNGAYTNAPALEQDAAYPMSNILNGDRYLPWKTSATPVQFPKLDLDLSADRSVRHIALHGLRFTSVAEYLVPKPITAFLEYRTAAQGYDGSLAFTAFGSGSVSLLGGRDATIDAGSNQTFRYLRVRFSDSLTSPFALGHIYAGLASYDMARGGSPGSSRPRVRRAIRTEGMGGAATITEIGDSSRDFLIQWNQIGATLLGYLDGVFAARKPVTIIDIDNKAYQATPRDFRLDVPQQWDTPAVYNVTLDLEGLA